tara:strand:- start:19223 stop:19618 length:396 start_codon:yes stop_codon:yes gene_type:complete
MTLVLTLVITTLMGLSAMALFSASRIDSMIAGNIRRDTIAKHAAISGINHFMSMNKPVSDIKRMIREHSGAPIVVIQRTYMDDNRMSYEVTVMDSPLSEPNLIMVQSIGDYRKGGKVVASKSILATVASTK